MQNLGGLCYNLDMHKTLFYILISLNLAVPWFVLASFDRDLYFGLRNDSEVTKLQEFLTGRGIYSGPITGGFFSLTREAVKDFQKKEGIEPAAGYFGPLTRARANTLLASPQTKEEIIAELVRQISELQKQLQALEAKQTTETAKPEEPAPAPAAPIVETPTKAVKLFVSGTATSSFPAVETTIFKMGEFNLENNTSGDVLVSNFETIFSDEMDSTPNRNHKIYLLLRDGANISDTLISTTEFTFVLSAPAVGEPHKAVLNLPYNKIIKVGEKKTVSVWLEQLKYVRSGTLKLESTKTAVSTGIEVDSQFVLVLTKEPPL